MSVQQENAARISSLQGRNYRVINWLIEAIGRLSYVEKWIFISTVTAITSSLVIGLFYIMLRLVIKISAMLHGVHVETGLTDYSVLAIHSHNKFMIVVTLLLGAAISSIIVYKLEPEAEGAGAESVVEAYHFRAGSLRARIAAVKTVASALVLGMGGSAGPEGPSVQIGGSVGAFTASILKLGIEERRLALIAGAAAALSFIFQSPIGAAVFAAEILYEEVLEASALPPALLSSAIAYALSLHILGPEYKLPSILINDLLSLYSPAALGAYILLGLIEAVFAYAFVKIFYAIKERIDRLVEKGVINVYTKTIVGASLASLIGLGVPAVLGTGEELLGEMLSAFGAQEGVGQLVGLHGSILAILILLAVMKMLATSLTVGSGLSGGLLTPSLFIGAMVGQVTGIIIGPHIGLQPAVLAYVGMASLAGAAFKAPIGLAFFVAEIGGTPALIVPGLVASLTASLATRRVTFIKSALRKPLPPSTFTAESLLNILRRMGAKNINITIPSIAKRFTAIDWHASLRDAAAIIMRTGQRIVPIIDENRRVVGVLDPAYIGLDLSYMIKSSQPVIEVSLINAPIVRETDPLIRVLEEMVAHGVDYVIVVDKQYRYLGVIMFTDLLNAVLPYIATSLQQNSLSSRGVK
ncbi:chloride channel protein [Pyrofollis japonicus]|uniref:chloride channel protein n=1 Tax=Pyrofollis japonicus TaxID=3060460 RepID=UPI00295AF6FC|nr:chloride channel protein [Pyrofollis japonicus]BEP17709.1 chloride channel protein [Pyrofollis japonicus]